MIAYSLNRPIGMGTYPHPESGDWEIVNFNKRKFVEAIGRHAWGFVDYEQDMPQSELERYEMATVEMCAKPKLPPENVIRKMACAYLDERFADLEKLFDKAERKGYDLEALDCEIRRMAIDMNEASWAATP